MVINGLMTRDLVAAGLQPCPNRPFRGTSRPEGLQLRSWICAVYGAAHDDTERRAQNDASRRCHFNRPARRSYCKHCWPSPYSTTGARQDHSRSTSSPQQVVILGNCLCAKERDRKSSLQGERSQAKCGQKHQWKLGQVNLGALLDGVYAEASTRTVEKGKLPWRKYGCMAR